MANKQAIRRGSGSGRLSRPFPIVREGGNNDQFLARIASTWRTADISSSAITNDDIDAEQGRLWSFFCISAQEFVRRPIRPSLHVQNAEQRADET